MVIAYGAFRSLPEPTSAARPSREWPVAFKAVLMARAMGDYTRLMIFPSNLHMDRSIVEPRSYTSRSTWRSSAQVEYLSLLGGVAFAALAFGCMRPGKGRRLRVFGAGWFVVGYLPVSNIVQLNASVAEHWLYLPSVGFLIFIAGCLVELPPKFRRVTVAAACLACIALAGRSVARSSDWSDEETFYTRTYDSGGTSIRVSSNLAQVYSAKGDLPAAERVFRKVLEIDPSYPSARNNLANLLRKQGRVAEADQLSASTVQASAKTRKEYPRTWMAAVNLATHRREQGDFAAALEIATRTRRDYPRIWEAVRSEAELLRLLGRHEEGLQLVSDYVQQHWWHHGASMALGQLYAQANDAERAAEAWRHASRLDVRDAESLSLLAAMRVRQNRLEEAAETQRRAVARQPDEPSRYRQLAAILERMGRTDEARVAQSHFARLQTLAAQPAISR
jgi:protein O-mannosyl-transferase